jgi:hypothetical protein
MRASSLDLRVNVATAPGLAPLRSGGAPFNNLKPKTNFFYHGATKISSQVLMSGNGHGRVLIVNTLHEPIPLKTGIFVGDLLSN